MVSNVGAVVALVLISVPCFAAAPASAELETLNDNRSIWHDISNLDVTTFRQSDLACPLPIVGAACGEETIFYYFTCCGFKNETCCFRLQHWVIAAIIVGAVGMGFIVLFVGLVLMMLIRGMIMLQSKLPTMSFENSGYEKDEEDEIFEKGKGPGPAKMLAASPGFTPARRAVRFTDV